MMQIADRVIIDNKLKSLPPKTADGEKPSEIDIESLERRQRELLELQQEERIQNEIRDGVERVLSQKKAHTDEECKRLIEAAKKSAKQMNEDALNSVHSLMESAEKDAGLLKIKATDDGYKAGYEAAKTDALNKYNKYIDAAAKLIADINSKKAAYFTANEEELFETIMTLTEKVINTEVMTNPAVVNGIIAEAAKSYRNSKELEISLPDCDVSRTFKADATLMEKLIPTVEHIEIKILEDAPAGTVILDDGENVTDASVPTQLEFLREIMKNTRKNGNGLLKP
jgi:flagellar biosynthesis/type III secretory pathway protein FliH